MRLVTSPRFVAFGPRDSGDSDAPYHVEREFEDIAAVVDTIAREESRSVSQFGHSYGLVSLGAALRTDHQGKLVLYSAHVGRADIWRFFVELLRFRAAPDGEESRQVEGRYPHEISTNQSVAPRRAVADIRVNGTTACCEPIDPGGSHPFASIVRRRSRRRARIGFVIRG